MATVTKKKTAGSKTKTVAKPKKSTKKTIPSTEFELYAPDASEVYLVGDFNDWDTAAAKMRKFKNGVCKKSLKLKPGRYQYLYLVDGHWWTDPNNSEREQNPYGTENSVITIS